MQSEELNTPSLSLESLLEALIFVAPAPVTAAQLAAVIGTDEDTIKTALSRLQEDYQQRGLRLRYHQGRYELTTAPEVSTYVERLLGLE
ncbi:MAG: SMC-Scp complex subunit ScpB, partial [Thermanaerothrix sp.]|nr:SMC-Scp complex subunit ScpB [Thermanaerothrix sp.]